MRTTVLAVKQILDDTQLTTSVIESYINSANVMVTHILGTTLDTTVLTEIERWLAAHMISSTRERQSIREEAGTARVDYSDVFGKGLASTTYGQMVLTLDTTGAMAEASRATRPVAIYAIKSFED